MKKATLNKLRANLDKALEPPRAPASAKTDNSDSIAQRYAVPVAPPAAGGAESVPGTDSAPGTESRTTPVQNVPGLESVPRVESVPRRGYLRLANEFVYDIMPRLKPSDGYVLLYLIARTRGFRRETVTVTLDAVAKSCCVSRSQARVNINSLIKRGFIRHLGTDTSNRNPLLRGLVLEVLQPPAGGAESVPGTDSAPGTDSTPIKEYIKENTHNTEPAAPGVRVNSRFTLQECRRYADNLRKDGITNPGGYATRIHRSGEADELVAAFLAPAPASPSMDASRCPDCSGTGFRQHESGQGVVKCKHERLPPALARTDGSPT